jgi:ADP-dependent phosphofructokinase/glucokinase
MGEKIAIGFHTCTDYELIWDPEVLPNLIRKYGITNNEIGDINKNAVKSERDLLLNILYFLKKGAGGELIPLDPLICNKFAENFKYNITIGGTATRAAIAISKIGFGSVVHMVCNNAEMQKLLPKNISYISSVGELSHINPHVVLQYPAGFRVFANGIDFVTPRENRVLISRDLESMEYKLTKDFIPLIKDAEVFLLSCYSEILDFDILTDRVAVTREILRSLSPNAVIIMEDGDYVIRKHKDYVHRNLNGLVKILSMNEDELQCLIEKSIDILNPAEVLKSVENAFNLCGFPYILIHSSKWALIYGAEPAFAKPALESAINMASTRFIYGDDFGTEEFEKTGKLKPNYDSVKFCDIINSLGAGKICCVPAKNLEFVKNPTSVGLGDFFAGGLLPRFIKLF